MVPYNFISLVVFSLVLIVSIFIFGHFNVVSKKPSYLGNGRCHSKQYFPFSSTNLCKLQKFPVNYLNKTAALANSCKAGSPLAHKPHGAGRFPDAGYPRHHGTSAKPL